MIVRGCLMTSYWQWGSLEQLGRDNWAELPWSREWCVFTVWVMLHLLSEVFGVLKARGYMQSAQRQLWLPKLAFMHGQLPTYSCQLTLGDARLIWLALFSLDQFSKIEVHTKPKFDWVPWWTSHPSTYEHPQSIVMQPLFYHQQQLFAHTNSSLWGRMVLKKFEKSLQT